VSLSSQCLFHFTPEYGTIESILKDGIAPSYCAERLPHAGKFNQYHIAMISFCDIPLSEISNIRAYGSYAIGLTMDWGKKHKMNPVLYLDRDSNVAHYVYETAQFIVNNKADLKASLKGKAYASNIDDLWIGTGSVLCSCKLYSGDLVRNGAKISGDYKFCNEREWRYLPFQKMSTGRWFNETNWKKTEWYTKPKPHLADQALQVSPNDIKYIILASESDVHDFLAFLSNMSGPGWSKRAIELLSTKVLTMQQILDDF
jgi:hypothetical protein